MPSDTTYTMDDFAETLLKEKNYTTLTDEMHAELKRDILDRAQDFLIAKTISKLSDEQAQKLSELLDTNPPNEKVQEFIKTSITDAPKFIGDTLFLFRQSYLGLV